MPQVQYVEKIVEVPEVRIQEADLEVKVFLSQVVKHVPKIEVQEVVKHVPKIEARKSRHFTSCGEVQLQERIVEHPQVHQVEARPGVVFKSSKYVVTLLLVASPFLLWGSFLTLRKVSLVDLFFDQVEEGQI